MREWFDRGVGIAGAIVGGVVTIFLYFGYFVSAWPFALLGIILLFVAPQAGTWLLVAWAAAQFIVLVEWVVKRRIREFNT